MLRALRAALAYFSLVFGAGFVLGAVRVTFVVPRLGERAAELVEMPFMVVVVVLAARFVVRRIAQPPTLTVRVAVGGVALLLALAAELILAVAMQGRSVGEYVASRDPVSGSAFVATLLLFAAMPALVRPSTD